MDDINNTVTESEAIQDEPVQGEAETKEEQGEKKNVLTTSFFEATSVVVTAITIIAIIFTFCFRLVGVKGSSMEDTLYENDWLIVTPYYGEPEYGDIVISVKDTAAEGALVKRVIGVAGDVVYVDEYDNVYVNGEEINDDAFVKDDGQVFRHGDLKYPVVVPEGCVMLMGDHRSVSWDSRYSSIGFAENDYLLGKAQLRLNLHDWNIYANFPEEKTVSHGENLVTVTTDEMAPVLNNGDVVFADYGFDSFDLTPGSIVVCKDNSVKRLEVSEGGLVANPDGSTFYVPVGMVLLATDSETDTRVFTVDDCCAFSEITAKVLYRISENPDIYQ